MLVQGPGGAPAVYHAAAHGNGPVHDGLQESRVAGQAQGAYPTLGHGEVDGFCKVKRHDAWVAQI